MDWNRHRRRIYAHLGVDVVWTPASSGIAAAAVRAFFDNPFRLTDFGDGGIEGREPVIDLIDEEFAGLVKGDTLKIGSARYRVKSAEKDGLGGVLVRLSGPIPATSTGTGFLLEDGTGAILMEDGSHLLPEGATPSDGVGLEDGTGGIELEDGSGVIANE